MMEFQPFGRDTNGQRIQDASGVTVAANVEFLEECVRRRLGTAAVEGTVAEMVRLLNERIHDRAYHVTLDFLKNQRAKKCHEPFHEAAVEREMKEGSIMVSLPPPAPFPRRNRVRVTP